MFENGDKNNTNELIKDNFGSLLYDIINHFYQQYLMIVSTFYSRAKVN